MPRPIAPDPTMSRKRQILSPFPKPDHVHESCLSRALNRAEAVCTERGLRLTKLRRRVLELVCAGHEPVKAYDLLDRLRAERRGAAPPTVYRALDFLRRQGLVHKIQSLNAFVGCGEPGHGSNGQFLICRDCGEVAEMDDARIVGLLSEQAHRAGFDAENQTIEVRGLCSVCRADE
jgi:Fur family zinc uptake transcriptional regulator